MTTPVCSTCSDTHRMALAEREVPCTRCPVPCSACCGSVDGIATAYCATTPCACPCLHDRVRDGAPPAWFQPRDRTVFDASNYPAGGGATPPSGFEDSAVRCLDCRQPYAELMACELIVPREHWLRIHRNDSGVLCANCMLRRVAGLPGAINITGRITFVKEYHSEVTPYVLATVETMTTASLDALRARIDAVLKERYGG
jgi:hypothetical protein